jgi:hypothetical protein
MPTRDELSILSRVRPDHLVSDPFPHLVIENALDPDVFAALEATYPSDELIVDNRAPVQDTWYDYSAARALRDERIAPLWREFFAYHVSREFHVRLVGLFGDAIRALHPDLETRVGRRLEDFVVGVRPGGRGNPLAPGADVSMECQFYLNFNRAPRKMRGPHVDAPSELFAGLLYFRQSADESSGGDLQICRGSEALFPSPGSVKVDRLPAEIAPDKVQVVRTVRYAPNTLVLFLNSTRSIHAVSVRSPTRLSRRHINLCCDLRLDLFEMQLPLRLKVKQGLERSPVVWRLSRYV